MEALTASIWVELAYAESKSSKSIGGRSPSLRWPHLYDILVRKGYSAEKAARISNAKVKMKLPDSRLQGVTADTARRYSKKHNL